MLAKRPLLTSVFALALFALPLSVSAETIETRIGKIELENGFPTAESAKKLFDESDFQRATQAYLWALPAVGFHGLHLAHLNMFSAKDGDLVLYVTLKDKAGMLTPNLTTVYAMSFWNMAEKGPLVIDVPSGLTAGGVLHVWQRPVTDTGQTGPDKGKGGKIPDPASWWAGGAGTWLYRAAFADQSAMVRDARARHRPEGSRSDAAQAPALRLERSRQSTHDENRASRWQGLELRTAS
jgi:hypothetical protein